MEFIKDWKGSEIWCRDHKRWLFQLRQLERVDGGSCLAQPSMTGYG